MKIFLLSKFFKNLYISKFFIKMAYKLILVEKDTKIIKKIKLK